MSIKEYKELKQLIEESEGRTAKKLAEIENEIKNSKNEILSAVDGYAKRAEDQWQEHNMLIGQVDRHEKWISNIAKKTNVKLDY